MKKSLIVLVLTLTTVVVLSSGDAQAENRKGAKAPEITLSDGINGITAKTKLAGYRGSPVLLVHWLPTCPHCQKFMPTVHKFHKAYGPKGLKILTVSIGKKAYTARYLSDRGWSFGVGFDWTGAIKRAFGIKRRPGIRLIGADGYLRSYTGTLEAAIRAELAAPR